MSRTLVVGVPGHLRLQSDFAGQPGPHSDFVVVVVVVVYKSALQNTELVPNLPRVCSPLILPPRRSSVAWLRAGAWSKPAPRLLLRPSLPITGQPI